MIEIAIGCLLFSAAFCLFAFSIYLISQIKFREENTNKVSNSKKILQEINERSSPWESISSTDIKHFVPKPRNPLQRK
jgi:hypothetical protein